MKISTKGTQVKTRLKKDILIKKALMLMCLTIIFSCPRHVLAAQESAGTTDYLVKTGMSVQEIGVLDGDARQFIADDLRNSGESDWKINRDILTLTKTSSEQYTAVFYTNVFAFQAGSDYRIYVVYESSTWIMPVGNDSLFFGMGDGFVPREYGGRIWYKKAGDENWTLGGDLTADHQTQGGGLFTGRQLGDFQRKTLVKGCVYCHADEGAGTDNGVTMEYTHKPPKESSEITLYIMIVAITVIVVLILRRE